jgi:ATP-dependent DNA helicase RecQ
MEDYISLKADVECEYIGKYFGDEKMKRCGMCDNCIAQKNVELTHDEFKK